MKIIVADDHQLVRESLAQSLSRQYPEATIIEAADGQTVLNTFVNRTDISLLLLDLKMPETKPFDLLSKISANWPSAKLVVLSASESQTDVDLAIDNGANAYIPKTTQTDELLSIVQQVLKGKMYVPELSDDESITAAASSDILKKPKGASKRKLPDSMTRRQIDVLRLLVKGKSNQVIAEELQLSPCTIKIHVVKIFKALEVKNRTEAVIKARNYRISSG